MKKLAFLLLAFVIFAMAMPIVLFMSSARAVESGACYAIGDADARAYCLARARREVSMCYAIQRADVRAACLAEVRR